MLAIFLIMFSKLDHTSTIALLQVYYRQLGQMDILIQNREYCSAHF